MTTVPMIRRRACAALPSVAKASDKYRLSRRSVLARGVGLGGLLLLPGRAWAAEQHDHTGTPSSLGLVPDKIVPAMDQPLIEPQVRRSAEGVLQTSLNCQYAYHDVGGARLYVRTFEGTVPGPTMRMKPGEVLRIRLANNFPPNRDLVPMEISNPHQYNNTNFHFHGVHASPSGISDNVMRSMEPGHTYDIEIKVPKDHPRGTYWYHPHHHGSADVQMASGMVGVIVIEGDFADVPEIANARERVMVLSQVVFDAWGMIESFDTLFPETATRFLAVNGQRRPVIEMRPGEVQRWRLLHAGYQDDLLMELQNHELHAVAYDGIQLGSVEHFKQMVIVPGQRTDVLVQAGAPGTYELRAVDYDQGHASPTGPLARVVVAGDPMPMKLPASLPKPPFESIKDSELTGRRKIVLSATSPEADAAGHWQEFAFLVDGKKFDPTRIDQRVKLGSVEEWTIENTHTHDDHIFHIHVNPFEVTQVNGKPLGTPQWRDTAMVERKGGTLTFRSRFIDFTGVYMMHCHMMNHEEMGMMASVEVYED